MPTAKDVKGKDVKSLSPEVEAERARKAAEIEDARRREQQRLREAERARKEKLANIKSRSVLNLSPEVSACPLARLLCAMLLAIGRPVHLSPEFSIWPLAFPLCAGPHAWATRAAQRGRLRAPLCAGGGGACHAGQGD